MPQKAKRQTPTYSGMSHRPASYSHCALSTTTNAVRPDPPPPPHTTTISRPCFADNPDIQYDIGYFKRDTRRAPKQIHSYVAPSLRQLADERAKASLLAKHEMALLLPSHPSPGLTAAGNPQTALLTNVYFTVVFGAMVIPLNRAI